jgi:imidazolonepropionase
MKSDSQHFAREMIFVNAGKVVTCSGPARARRGGEMRDAGVQNGVWVAMKGERIAAVGTPGEIARQFPHAEQIDCGGRLLTPGLVDSHTHSVFGRARYEEQELRAAGVGYMEIASRGGGIHASVRDVQSRSEEDLFNLAHARLNRLASYGTTTVEVKSGYGLTLEHEVALLRVIERLRTTLSMRVVPTWLGAHEIPPQARASDASRTAHLDMLIEEMLPSITGQNLARFADVFCEPGVFTVAESRRLLDAAQRAGLGIKLHADELETSGGAELAAEMRATSADHLAAISDAGIAALATSGTVATLLPGTMLFLGRQAHAPARKLIDQGVPVALATDFNPGTSPTVNFPLILTLGVSQLHMSAAEAFIAATVNGAAALGLASEVGQLTPGFYADIALWDAEDLRELPYWYGDRLCRGTWARGKTCSLCDLRLS